MALESARTFLVFVSGRPRVSAARRRAARARCRLTLRLLHFLQCKVDLLLAWRLAVHGAREEYAHLLATRKALSGGRGRAAPSQLAGAGGGAKHTHTHTPGAAAPTLLEPGAATWRAGDAISSLGPLRALLCATRRWWECVRVERHVLERGNAFFLLLSHLLAARGRSSATRLHASLTRPRAQARPRAQRSRWARQRPRRAPWP
jgi:hypothetical protein